MIRVRKEIVTAMTLKRSNVLAFCASALVLSVLLPAASQAQTAQQLSRDMDKLERQVKALQRKVFKGDTTYFDENRATSTQQIPAGPQSAAAQMVRLDALEATVRTLTGRIEEMQYTQQQTNERFETFMAEAQYRLSALDGAGQPQTADTADAANTLAGQQERAQQSFQQNFTSPPGSVEPSNTAVSAATAKSMPGTNSAGGLMQAKPVALPQDPKAQFDEAFQLARRDRFDDAEQAFMMFIADHPEHELASNAQYWLGRVYTAKRQTSQAAEAFFEGYRRYPEGNKAPENLLAFASTLRVMEKTKEACTALALLKSKIAENAYPDVSDRVRQGIDSESSVLACS